MKLKSYFLILALCIGMLAGILFFATFHSHPALFYVSEALFVFLLAYLYHFYRRAIRSFDTLIGGMELVRHLDMSTRLSPSGQHETDVIVHAFNDLLSQLRNEHLRLEEQYTFLRLLIEASPMGIVQCDQDGSIASMNTAARQMLSPAIEDTMRSLPLGKDLAVRIPGEPQVFRVSHRSFPDRGFHHPFYLIESLTEEVRRAEKTAYERIIRMIAHEVNNSVAGILGLVHSPESTAHSRDIAGERLAALSAFVTRFADVVKTPRPQLQLCDLSEEVEACRPFLENLCKRTQVGIDFRLTDEAMPVRLDTVLFQQVLINIVKNSIESIGEAHGSITVSANMIPDTLSPTQSRPVLIITDNGRGISPTVASQLFTPFFSTKPQGQGIGLLLIRDILTAHGCTFSLLTHPDDLLTRFTIHFLAYR